MYIYEKFLPNEKFTYGVSDTEEGNMSFLFNGIEADHDEVIKNRISFANKVGIPHNSIVSIRVTFGTDILEATNEDTMDTFLNSDDIHQYDAVITREKGLGLFLRVADCVPMLLTDKEKSFIALIHGGWKNTDQEYINKVIHFVNSSYNIPSSELELFIGPSILKDSYIYDYFDKKDSDPWLGFTEELENGKVKIDNTGLTIQQALDSGIKRESIFNCGIDAYTDERFYSHKRDYDLGQPDEGRLAILAMLK